MPLEAQAEHFEVFDQITTVPDAARRWGFHQSTIRYAIDTGNIAAVKIGGTWLISVESMVAYYGSELCNNILLNSA